MSLERAGVERHAWGCVVMTSGGFDPIHPGHTSCIVESKQHGDTLVVVVNGDSFLAHKKGRSFMDLSTRCAIVSAIRGVDVVIPFEISGDTTICVALSTLVPAVFTKGGDRNNNLDPREVAVCDALGIRIITGVGLDKKWSSSNLLREWVNHAA